MQPTAFVAATRPRLVTARSFLETEAGGAVILLAATLVALVWANSPWWESYFQLWATELSIELGSFHLGMELGHWISDGLMALFFLLIGLEIRREFDLGDLRDRRRIALPLSAAIGGMVVPALIFLTLNRDPVEGRGWAMVMATDTAFALGVLALVGRQAPIRYRVFLLTLMVVDDVGAVSVIAVAYSDDVSFLALGVAVALLAAIVALRRLGVQRSGVYVILGIATWLATLEAGIHPTVAGVAIGLTTSAYSPRREELQRAIGLTREFREQPTAELADAASQRIRFSLSPNDRLQHTLHPWTSFVVVPLFALANAGVVLSPDSLERALSSSITWGIVLGLVVGKSVGIVLGAWVATRTIARGAPMPIPWLGVVKLASVAGIGFTVSLLVAQLSYVGPMLEDARIGILAASAVAAVWSVALFRIVHALPTEWLRRAEASSAPALADLMVPVDPERDHIRGPLDATITLVQYGDYECPHCREAAPNVHELLARLDGDLRFVARHLPLPDIHPGAALAAEAAEAAGAQDRFWEMHDRLYLADVPIGPAVLDALAADIGLDVERFREDLVSSRFARVVAQHVATAERSGVAGTPTFFINDIRYHGTYDIASLERALRTTLRTAQLQVVAAPV
jgi:Na+/H+ antiporter NhaA